MVSPRNQSELKLYGNVVIKGPKSINADAEIYLSYSTDYRFPSAVSTGQNR